MNIAKAIGVGYNFVMDDKNDKDVYFGQSYMKVRFVDKEVNQSQKMRTSQHLHSSI